MGSGWIPIQPTRPTGETPFAANLSLDIVMCGDNWLMSPKAHLRNLRDIHRKGNATEHSYRPALKNLLEGLRSGITATNEPARGTDLGAMVTSSVPVPLRRLRKGSVGRPRKRWPVAGNAPDIVGVQGPALKTTHSSGPVWGPAARGAGQFGAVAEHEERVAKGDVGC